MSLKGGWQLVNLIDVLNSLVFFWPGKFDKPIDYGVRHYNRYAEENPKIIRMKSADLFSANLAPLFCAFNSGSPRCTGGKGSPRGTDTFVTAAAFPKTASGVVELTFKGSVHLPASAEIAGDVSGPWFEF